MLNEEIPVSKYQKKINHMSKFVETMFDIILGKTINKYFPFQCL